MKAERSPLVRSRSSIALINQSHLLKAAEKMRPSVSEEERLKYRKIYANFLSSHGSAVPDAGSKQTLA
ncbi:hypothetical protein ScPMuIL_018363 [Solemya velum]